MNFVGWETKQEAVSIDIMWRTIHPQHLP